MGKLIVIEGTDGSGKSTQFRMLSEHLERDGRAFKHIVFPRYDQESSALIRMYLGGQFGSKCGEFHLGFGNVGEHNHHKQIIQNTLGDVQNVDVMGAHDCGDFRNDAHHVFTNYRNNCTHRASLSFYLLILLKCDDVKCSDCSSAMRMSEMIVLEIKKPLGVSRQLPSQNIA